MAKQVVITGLGVVSPIGTGLDGYWRALLEGENLPTEDANLQPAYMKYRHTYAIAGRQPIAPPGSTGITGGTASRFAIEAARMALADAGLLEEHPAESVIGVSIGSAMGDDVFETERVGGPKVAGLDTFSFEVAAALGAELSLEGPNLSVSTACSAGLYSISLAAGLIQAGQADVMVVGGAEAISRVALGCFNRLSALDPEACRPFDPGRKGTVMGEGAAILVLESEEHLRRRGGERTYARLAGAGWSCDGHHATIPEPSGRPAMVAARRALADAGIGPEAIGCVLAHGTGTEQNDLTESKMIEDLFAGRDDVWVSAIKGKLGHGGGAAGAFQALTGALVLERGWVPPTGNTRSLDPRCKLQLALGAPRRMSGTHVLMNSYAFGGNNISLILGQTPHA